MMQQARMLKWNKGSPRFKPLLEHGAHWKTTEPVLDPIPNIGAVVIVQALGTTKVL